MNVKLFEDMACPICHHKLRYDAEKKVLICTVDKLAYPIRDDIPVMLPEEARALDQ